jgi:hypothetical protein
LNRNAYSNRRHVDPSETPPLPVYVLFFCPIVLLSGKSSSRSFDPGGAPTIENVGDVSPK